MFLWLHDDAGNIMVVVNRCAGNIKVVVNCKAIVNGVSRIIGGGSVTNLAQFWSFNGIYTHAQTLLDIIS
jgi:hypothetical protein